MNWRLGRLSNLLFIQLRLKRFLLLFCLWLQTKRILLWRELGNTLLLCHLAKHAFGFVVVVRKRRNFFCQLTKLCIDLRVKRFVRIVCGRVFCYFLKLRNQILLLFSQRVVLLHNFLCVLRGCFTLALFLKALFFLGTKLGKLFLLGCTRTFGTTTKSQVKQALR